MPTESLLLLIGPRPGEDPDQPFDLPPGDFPEPQPEDPQDPRDFPPGDLPVLPPVPNPLPGGA